MGRVTKKMRHQELLPDIQLTTTDAQRLLPANGVIILSTGAKVPGNKLPEWNPCISAVRLLPLLPSENDHLVAGESVPLSSTSWVVQYPMIQCEDGHSHRISSIRIFFARMP